MAKARKKTPKPRAKKSIKKNLNLIQKNAELIRKFYDEMKK